MSANQMVEFSDSASLFDIFKQEEEYGNLYFRLHGWDKRDICTLQGALFDASKYFKAFPYSLDLKSFLIFFDLTNDFYFHFGQEDFPPCEYIITGPDRDGNCLKFTYSAKYTGCKILNIGDLEHITK